jgi:hypothetical protein
VPGARAPARRDGRREVDPVRVGHRAAQQVQRAAHLRHRRSGGRLDRPHVGGERGRRRRGGGALRERAHAVQQQRDRVLQLGGDPAPFGGEQRVDARQALHVDLRHLALEPPGLTVAVAQRVARACAADHDRREDDVLLLADQRVVALVGGVEQRGGAEQQRGEHGAAHGRPAPRRGFRGEQRDRERERVDGRVRGARVDRAAQQHEPDHDHRGDDRRARDEQQRERQDRGEQQRGGRRRIPGIGDQVPQDRGLGDAPGDEQGDGAAEEDQLPAAAAGPQHGAAPTSDRTTPASTSGASSFSSTRLAPAACAAST